jgi:heme-degrading monooxygenase HmoA
MIVEVASIRVKAGEEARFETAAGEAAKVFERAEGCLGLSLHRCFAEPPFVMHFETVFAEIRFADGKAAS